MLKYKIPQIVTLTQKKLHKSMIYKALDEYSKREYLLFNIMQPCKS